MKQKFDVFKFSSITTKMRYSKTFSYETFSARMAIRISSSNAEKIWVQLVVWPADQDKQMCYEIRAAISVLNRQNHQPVHESATFPSIGPRCRVLTAVFSKQDTSEATVCVHDKVLFEADFELQVIEPRFGSPLSHPKGLASLRPTSKAFLTDEMADVTLVIGSEGKEFRVNKTILSARSPVFHAMFFGPEPADERIGIPDVPVPAFGSLLRYFHCQDLVIDKTCLMGTVFAAEKYKVPDVLYAIGVLLDPEAIVSILNIIAGNESQEQLKSQIRDYISEKAETFISSRHFVRLLPVALKFVIGSVGKLNWEAGDRFVRLWKRCEAWAEYNCRVGQMIASAGPVDKRKVMESFLPAFPFRMSPQQFKDGPEASGILTPELVTEYYRKFALCVKESESLDVSKKMKFC